MEEFGYNLTADLIRKSRTYGMADVHYMIYADLRACGWTMRNAWMVAFNGYGVNWTKDMLEKEMNRLESLESVQKRIEEVMGKRTSEKEELTPEELAKATSKEKILSDLVIAQRRQKQGSPDWLKTTALIADYNKIKQDDIQVEDTTCHFYLPLSYPNRCEDCLIFKNGKSKLKPKPKG